MAPVSTAEHKLVASLIALMEAGTAPWRRPWDAGGGGHHVNLLSGRRYRGANPVLLTLGMHGRGSLLPYWCGFTEARARGLTPRRGCRAVHVLRPQLLPPDQHEAPRGETPGREDTSEPAGAAEPGAAELGAAEPRAAARIRYRPVAVFNAADLVGDGLVALIAQRRFCEGLDRRPETERLAHAEAVLGGWTVPVSHGGERAFYLPALDRIQLPERSAFSSAAGLYATWAHEAIHSTGHPSRLGRDLAGRFGSAAYAREELVAELGAVLLGDRLEIGSPVEHHAAYLSLWVELLRERPSLLLQLLSQARRAADLIAPEPAAVPASETWQESAARGRSADCHAQW
jgi:antirestriction protein ArdC